LPKITICYRNSREIIQFVALPFDLTQEGLVAGDPFKCETPASAIERAKAMWKIFSHSGAVALVRAGYPETRTAILRKFGNVPDNLPV
jgi:hypothetical protein